MSRFFKNFKFDNIKNIPFLVPLREEQKKIGNYLNQKYFVINELIDKKEQYLSKIENYKKFLIDEYVMGKTEVNYIRNEPVYHCSIHSNRLSNEMDKSLLAVRGINHKYIVVDVRYHE